MHDHTAPSTASDEASTFASRAGLAARGTLTSRAVLLPSDDSRYADLPSAVKSTKARFSSGPTFTHVRQSTARRRGCGFRSRRRA